MEILMFLLRICLVSSVLVAASPSGLDLLPPLSSPPSPLPEASKGFGQVPISPPESHNPSNAPPPKASQPSLPAPVPNVVAPPQADSAGGRAPAGEPIVSVPNAPAPVKDLPGKSPPVQPVITPVASPPKEPPFSGRVSPGPVSSDIPPLPSVARPPPPIPSVHKPPIEKPIAPVASPPTDISPPVHPVIPKLPSSSPVPTSGSPTRKSPITHPVFPIESPAAVSPDHPPPSHNGDENKSPVAAPSNETAKPLPVIPHKAASPPSIAPLAPKFNGHSHHTPPDTTPSNVHRTSSSAPPPPSYHRHHQERTKITNSPPPSPPPPMHIISPKKPNRKGSVSPPLPSLHHAHSPPIPSSLISPAHPPISSSMHRISIAPAPSPTQVLPLRSSSRPSKSRKFPLGPPLPAFPPPPPNSDCTSTVCLEPYTNTPPGSPCGCVWPIQVELRLSMALYDFFPMVSEFAREISAGVFMKQSQVRIMGANAASEQPDKSIVLIDLVPLGDKFDNMTAMLTYQRFWSKKVQIFGQYDVIYVRYPGLPASPPVSGMTVIDQGPYPGGDNNGRAMKPLGVDVPKKMRKKELTGETVAVIVLSAAAFIGLCFVIVWFLVFRRRRDQRASKRAPLAQPSLPSLTKPSGSARSLTGSRLSSTSLSFASSIAPFTVSAKTFTASEIVKATNNFAESRVLGEGGFGKVYEGLFDDGTKVAVKVLKRDDQQGGREFLAEVEMLSRLHHRNLVNLIGICIEDRNRSLVYELIPNGSVESHLHGVDKEASPLDWEARLKIALGAARGLAYLHEDSSPRVIHRDFKSSNILLEHDFTPKVSDFGLARNALDDEDNRHISTRVMGTFGYVVPEYAMTGHLLVKSDVYSYGVVLLELLTGRKPVDMMQPPGQENLVSWTRSLLTSREGLEAIIDQSLGQPEIPFDSIAKVAAIASMCVQPEVSHRPFMGEVVQALKLVCNECDEAKELNSVASLTQDENRAESSCGGEGSGRMARYPLLPSYDSEPDTERGLSVSEMFTGSGRLERQSNSGPLASVRGKRFWQKMRRLSTGSLSEHGSASLMVRSGSR
ncbi:PREDICTED: receptor-like serine/threonine-protein kinase ALE2 isoform X4 [Brassica oleracea var. oleracea]|uniref:receptor-like serine/threonine-protein kinase ALE2 isoform X4 n=1 Tax=Brassica oleracea var. oleracea TaxID=109376 RepID=UPI0006A74C16|nr:PREDICTED: receptor-like serine/threonine-protein kinase ALE2 isoform X4 [Brassica oleracea var. oleracea]